MQRVTLVRYTTKPECADENEALSRAVLTELEKSRAAHITYALFRNGNDFVHLLVNAKGADSTAMTELPSFKAYAAGIAARCVAPPEQTRLDLPLVGAYGLPSAMVPA